MTIFTCIALILGIYIAGALAVYAWNAFIGFGIEFGKGDVPTITLAAWVWPFIIPGGVLFGIVVVIVAAGSAIDEFFKGKASDRIIRAKLNKEIAAERVMLKAKIKDLT